ncbi:hypothetical protein AOLI_G00239850 [Acnodon oligacanthus]
MHGMLMRASTQSCPTKSPQVKPPSSPSTEPLGRST